MKVYEVTNGYIGCSYFRAIVVAGTEEQAKEIAEPLFKNEAKSEYSDEYIYKEKFWKNLRANVIIEDATKAQGIFQED
jgi:hypothetical protein